jgi:hypothetical protein
VLAPLEPLQRRHDFRRTVFIWIDNCHECCQQRHAVSDDPVSSHEGTCPQGAGGSQGQAVCTTKWRHEYFNPEEAGDHPQPATGCLCQSLAQVVKRHQRCRLVRVSSNVGGDLVGCPERTTGLGREAGNSIAPALWTMLT